jgi:hypothetical protein
MTLDQSALVITLGIAIISLVVALRKVKPDLLNLNAKTSQIFQDMLAEEVEKGIAKDKTILGLEIRISTLEKEYEKLCIENASLTDWCKRLVKQVIASGQKPVNMHSHNRGKPE